MKKKTTQHEELVRLERLLKVCVQRAGSDSRSRDLAEKLRNLSKGLPHISEEERARWLEEQRQALPKISEEARARWLQEQRTKH